MEKIYCSHKNKRKWLIRKYHFIIWRILAIALPVTFAAAILMRPRFVVNQHRIENDFSFSVKKIADSTVQVIINVKNPLKVPSCLVYASFASKDILLGTLDHQGLYKFEIKKQDDQDIHVKLYDVIHKREIKRVQLMSNSE